MPGDFATVRFLVFAKYRNRNRQKDDPQHTYMTMSRTLRCLPCLWGEKGEGQDKIAVLPKLDKGSHPLFLFGLCPKGGGVQLKSKLFETIFSAFIWNFSKGRWG